VPRDRPAGPASGAVKRGDERPPAPGAPSLALIARPSGGATRRPRCRSLSAGSPASQRSGAQGAGVSGRMPGGRRRRRASSRSALPQSSQRERVVLRVRVVLPRCVARARLPWRSSACRGKRAAWQRLRASRRRAATTRASSVGPSTAVVPRMVGLGAVAVPSPLASCACAGRRRVGERETVVGADEVHRARRRAPARGEHVRGAARRVAVRADIDGLRRTARQIRATSRLCRARTILGASDYPYHFKTDLAATL